MEALSKVALLEVTGTHCTLKERGLRGMTAIVTDLLGAVGGERGREGEREGGREGGRQEGRRRGGEEGGRDEGVVGRDGGRITGLPCKKSVCIYGQHHIFDMAYADFLWSLQVEERK